MSVQGGSSSAGKNGVFEQLGLNVIERGWLSSNNVVFQRRQKSPATVIDTGYDSHSEQTVALVTQCLTGAPLERIVNTHLHSDHCGGNAALQSSTGCQTWVPAVSVDAVAAWDARRLTFDLTGQACRRFAADGGVSPGEQIALGGYNWTVLPAPGHDAEAVMFFQREARVLISGDALWQDRLAIIFSEIGMSGGFAATWDVLKSIEDLDPLIVIPGHGPPFKSVADALRASRKRLEYFEAAPDSHLRHAARALTMFHMLDVQRSDERDLLDWVLATPIFETFAEGLGYDRLSREVAAAAVLDKLVADATLIRDGCELLVPGTQARG